jgi:hypothetical protein
MLSMAVLPPLWMYLSVLTTAYLIVSNMAEKSLKVLTSFGINHTLEP